MVSMGEQMFRAVNAQLGKLRKENRADSSVEEKYATLLCEIWEKLNASEKARLDKEGIGLST